MHTATITNQLSSNADGKEKEMLGNRIEKLEKFFGVKKPKNMNPVEWLDKLYEMELVWEDENGCEFPI